MSPPSPDSCTCRIICLPFHWSAPYASSCSYRCLSCRHIYASLQLSIKEWVNCHSCEIMYGKGEGHVHWLCSEMEIIQHGYPVFPVCQFHSNAYYDEACMIVVDILNSIDTESNAHRDQHVWWWLIFQHCTRILHTKSLLASYMHCFQKVLPVSGFCLLEGEIAECAFSECAFSRMWF